VSEGQAVAHSEEADDGATAIERRAPFADSPHVGTRGRRTRQRILDAGLEVFAQHGFGPCSVEQITTLAGCSRAAFYQYFSGKSDLFDSLAAELARALLESTDGLSPLTPDAEGWAELRRWVARYSRIHDRFAPVLRAVPATLDDEVEPLPAGRVIEEQVVTELRARATGEVLVALSEPVIQLVLDSLPRAFDDATAIRSAGVATASTEGLCDAVTDVLHRTLFGQLPEVNARPTPPRRAGTRDALRLSAVLWRELQVAPGEDEGSLAAGSTGRPGRSPDGGPSRSALLEAGRDVFTAKGYHGTRIDDIVQRAGVSHGAFYLHFVGKEDFARVVAIRAMRSVSQAFVDFPDPASLDADGTELRAWLRRYGTSQAAEAAMIRVWSDSALGNPVSAADTAAVLDWGSRRMELLLAPRGYGDVEAEAIVLVAVLSAFGAVGLSEPRVVAATHVVRRGFLGR
jgi:AcrR family transcriptional regulator